MSRVTVSDVISFSGIDAPQGVIQALIDFVSQADECLIGAGVTDATAKLVKTYGVCHMLQMQSGGAVTSERSMTGDSVTYAEPAAGTSWLSMVRGMPGASCITGLIEQSTIQVFSAGRRA